MILNAVLYPAYRFGNPSGVGFHGYLYEVADRALKLKDPPHQRLTPEGYISDNQPKPAAPVNPWYSFDGGSPLPLTTVEQPGFSWGDLDLAVLHGIEALSTDLAKLDPELTLGRLYLCVKHPRFQEVFHYTETDQSQFLQKLQTRNPSRHALWTRLYQLRDASAELGFPIEVRLSTSVEGEFGYERGNWLSVVGSQSATSFLKFTPYAEVWALTPTRPHLFGHDRLYFLTDNTTCPYRYYLGAPSNKVETHFGYRTPDAAYTVVQLRQPATLLANFLAEFKNLAQGIELIATLRLDKFFHPLVYPMLESYGTRACQTSPQPRLQMHFADGMLLAEDLYPPHNAYAALSILKQLGVLLDAYLAYCSGSRLPQFWADENYQLHDLTSVFYESVGQPPRAKCQLKKDFPVGTRDLTVGIQYRANGKEIPVVLPLVLSLDLPERNILKRIESDQPKVMAMVWRHSEWLIEYAIVVESTQAVSLWSNHACNTLPVSF